MSDPDRGPDATLRPARADAEPAPPPHPSRVCPGCGAALDSRSCKLICPTPGCGYYLSCSDFY